MEEDLLAKLTFFVVYVLYKLVKPCQEHTGPIRYRASVTCQVVLHRYDFTVFQGTNTHYMSSSQRLRSTNQVKTAKLCKGDF